MAIVSKITDEMIVKGKGKVDFYKLRGILSVARNWPKRRETPFRPRELEAQGVFGILSKATTLIQDKVKEAWIVESIGKRPRWQDTFIGLGMKYWGVNQEIPPILLDYQVTWHSSNPELELLLLKIEEKYGKTEAQEIQTTGIITLEEIETYREKLFFSIYDNAGLRLIAPFLEFIVGLNIDFNIKLQTLAGFIEEPMKVCFSDANVRIPKTKTYYYHGVKYECVMEINPKPHKCLDIVSKEEPIYGPTKWKQFNSILNMGWSRRSGNYLWAHDHPVGEQYLGMVGQHYWYTMGEFKVGRYGLAFQVKGIKSSDLIVGATLYLNPVYQHIDEEFRIVIRKGKRGYPHIPTNLEDYNMENWSEDGGGTYTKDRHLAWMQFNSTGLKWIYKFGITRVALQSSRDIEAIEPIYFQEVYYNTFLGNARLLVFYKERFA